MVAHAAHQRVSPQLGNVGRRLAARVDDQPGHEGGNARLTRGQLLDPLEFFAPGRPGLDEDHFVRQLVRFLGQVLERMTVPDRRNLVHPDVRLEDLAIPEVHMGIDERHSSSCAMGLSCHQEHETQT